MAVLRWIFGFVITVAVAAVAVMNVETVPFTYSPVHDSVTLPVYLIALVPMALGFVFGAVIWLNMGKLRRERRKQKRDIKLLEKEVARLRKDTRDQSIVVTDDHDDHHMLSL